MDLGKGKTLKLKTLKLGILFLAIGSVGLTACAKTAKTGPPARAKLSRDYQIDPNSEKGLIYGKVVHHRAFGNKFSITFKNLVTNEINDIMVESFSATDTAMNLFMEVHPGEWVLHQITAEDSGKINISDLRQDENKEFIVEKGGISYVGTWTLSPQEFKALNEKEDQDLYMRINFKNVMTSSALICLP